MSRYSVTRLVTCCNSCIEAFARSSASFRFSNVLGISFSEFACWFILVFSPATVLVYLCFNVQTTDPNQLYVATMAFKLSALKRLYTRPKKRAIYTIIVAIIQLQLTHVIFNLCLSFSQNTTTTGSFSHYGNTSLCSVKFCWCSMFASWLHILFFTVIM